MKIETVLTAEQESGLAVVVAEFNAHQSEDSQLTAAAFAANEFAHVARQWEGAAKRALLAKAEKLDYDDLADLAPAIEAKHQAREAIEVNLKG